MNYYAAVNTYYTSLLGLKFNYSGAEEPGSSRGAFTFTCLHFLTAATIIIHPSRHSRRQLSSLRADAGRSLSSVAIPSQGHTQTKDNPLNTALPGWL